MKCSPPYRANGFTLIELLVVIGIIAALAGISLAAFGVFTGLGREKVTEVRIEQISSELEAILMDYPNDDYTSLLSAAKGGPNSSVELYVLLTGDLNKSGDIDGNEVKASKIAGLLLPPKKKADMSQDDWYDSKCWVTDSFQIKDGFNNPLRFWLSASSGFVGKKNSTSVGFDLWSAGQDGETGSDASVESADSKDDVGNWSN